MAIEFQTGLGGLGRRGREGRPARGLRPAVWVERLEDKVLMATAVTAFSIPPAGSISPMTQGADGNLWYERVTWSGGILNTRLSGRIGRVTPSGAVAEYPLPSGGYPATSLIAGPDGNLWFTSAANDASGNPTSAFVARVTPSGVISEYPLAAGVILTSDLVAGPDGNLWFAETIRTSSASALQGRIGRVTPSGVLTEYPLSPGEGAGDLIVGPDGNLWFLGTAPAASGLNLSGFVGRVTPSGVISKFAIPSVGYFTDLTVGSDGNLWFATTVDKNSSPQMRGRVSRVTLSGVVTEYILPSGGIATDLTAGPDGNLWFTETVYAASGPFLSSAIGRVTPSGVVSEYPLAGGGSALDLVVGPDGNLWFNETVYGDSGAQAGFIGRVTLSGVVAEYPLAAGHILPNELTIGPDGNLWFVGYVKAGDGTTSGLFIGRMSTSGAVSYESVSGLPPSGSAGLNFLNQSSLTIGADGNLWFTVTEQPRYSPTFSVPPTGVAIERVNVAAFPIPQLVSPTITGLLRTGVRAQPTRLVLSFDAALAVSSAEDLRNYVLVPSGPRGRVRPGIRPLAIRRASYDAASDTVTLTLGRRLPINRYYRVTVRGSLTGANGAPLDGSGRGQPGSDYHALLYKSGPVTPSAARSVGPGRIKLRLAKAGDKSA